jgi:glucose/arabinose dehydrogenase
MVGIGCLGGCGGKSASSQTASPTATATASQGAAEPAVQARRPAAVVAAGIPFPTNLAFDRDGGLWVTSGTSGRDPKDGVWYVPPGEPPRQVAKGLFTALGLVWVGDRLYVGHVTAPGHGRVTALEDFTGDRFESSHVVLDDLRVGRHTVASIAQGSSDRLFVGVGSLADNGGRPGRVLSFAPSGGTPVVEATGLRSAFGLAFDGERLLVTDNGRDDLGPKRPRDELNAFEPAGPLVDFGFPGCYDQGGKACEGSEAPFVKFLPHASPAGIGVKGDVAYVAENGSSFASTPSGRDVQRVDLRSGQHSVFWRSPVKFDPLGVAIGPDGDLYLTLYASGKVVRFDL